MKGPAQKNPSGSSTGHRLLFVTLRYPPYVAGGYELLTRDAAEALRARGHNVHVLAGKGERFKDSGDVSPWLEPDLDGEDPFQVAMGARFRERLRLDFLRSSNLEATSRAIAAFQPELVFFFNLGLVSLAPILAARRAKVPTLGYLSDPWVASHWLLDWRTSGRKPLRLFLLSKLWRCFRSYVDIGPALCCSQSLRERLVGEGLSSEATGVLHLGVPPDIEVATAKLEPPKREPGEALRVGCISALWKGKGQDVLVRALSLAREKKVPIELWLAAPSATDFRRELEVLVFELGLSTAVRFLDALTREDLSKELQRTHVLCVPSVWEEPFPLSTLEGMAHGLAVGVSTAGGSPEAIRDGEDGRVFPKGDAEALAQGLLDWESDEPGRLAMGRAAQASARGRLNHRLFIDGIERAIGKALAVGGAH